MGSIYAKKLISKINKLVWMHFQVITKTFILKKMKLLKEDFLSYRAVLYLPISQLF